MQTVEKDFEELLRLLNKHRARFCIVGAFAVGFHAIPRYTKDLDILVESNKSNGVRIVAALNEFGFGSLKLQPEDFDREERFIQLGYEPVRIDLITSISGCTFDEIWKNKEQGTYGNEKVYFIGLNELIKNKKASGRHQDITDLKLLQNSKKRK